MKAIKVVICLVVSLSLGRAQGQDTISIQVQEIDSIAEKLVQLAMDGPAVKVLHHSAEASRYIYKRSKTMWLNNISAMGNLNEFSLSQDGSTTDPLKQNSLFPRYNFGVTVPLGLFINNSKQTKSDKHRYYSNLEQVEIEKRNIRKEVLAAYQGYLMQLKLKDLQVQLVNDYEIANLKNEERFANGQISLDAYNNANIAYNNALNRQVVIEYDLTIAKYDLEALIGMRLEDALAMISPD